MRAWTAETPPEGDTNGYPYSQHPTEPTLSRVRLGSPRTDSGGWSVALTLCGALRAVLVACPASVPIVANPKSRLRTRNGCSTLARTDALRDSAKRSGVAIFASFPLRTVTRNSTPARWASPVMSGCFSADADEALRLAADALAHAAGLLLLSHTRRLALFGQTARPMMETRRRGLIPVPT